VKVWVVFADRAKLGDGRARFFELADELLRGGGGA
jgi:hypothetical protein